MASLKNVFGKCKSFPKKITACNQCSKTEKKEKQSHQKPRLRWGYSSLSFHGGLWERWLSLGLYWLSTRGGIVCASLCQSDESKLCASIYASCTGVWLGWSWVESGCWEDIWW